MLSDRLRARLAELNREPLPPANAQSLRAAREAKKQPLAAAADAAAPHVGADAVTAALPAKDDADRHGREVETPLGRHWLIERPLASLWNQADALLAKAQIRLAEANRHPQAHPDWRRFARAFPRQAALLDLETCGFAGSMVFLVGVIHEADDRLVLSQILARNYAEEPAMLYTLWQILQRRGLLLSFNGKSFDWPMVEDRSTLHRLDAAGHTRRLDHHIDLLHHARRRYRRELPNCKLQTLEWYLCGRRRSDDIPGSEIPDAYHRYVRTGEPGEMRTILHHNALDLITLLQLSLRLGCTPDET